MYKSNSILVSNAIIKQYYDMSESTIIYNNQICAVIKGILSLDCSSYLSSSRSSGSGKRETAKSHPNHSDTLSTNS